MNARPARKKFNPSVLMQQLMIECKEPQVVVDLSKKLGVSTASIYKYLEALEKKGRVVRIVDRSKTKKHMYQTARDYKETVIDTGMFRGLEQPEAGDAKNATNKITDKGVVVKQGNSTIVRGFNGYHPSKAERVRSKTYVAGGTLEML